MVERPALTEEYVTDVAYLRNFVEDLAPARLRLAAALNGFEAPPAERFRYCELGSGNGDTLATLAAANPEAELVGVDLNAEHVAFAQGLAERGRLSNVRFLERDFATLAGEDLGRFHYIGAHGVMSWVGPEKRQALIDFAASRLEPGGVLTVSYNALPGWAAVEPLRRLMLDASTGVVGTSIDRARHGLTAARVLCDAGAEYFVHNPAARTMLETMEKGGLTYVVHEYFSAHHTPLYFTDVAAQMAEAGLFFVGQLPLYLNYKDVAIPAALAKLFAGIGDRVVLERMKDFALNEFFRRDVYIKGRAPCSPANAEAYWASTRFAVPRAEVPREVRLPHFTLRYAGPVFEALLPLLATEASSLPELGQRPELAAYGVAALREALLVLLLGDVAAPRKRPLGPTVPTALGGRYRVPLAYNRMVLEQRLSSANPVVLASTLSGTGLALSTLHAAFAHLCTEVEPDLRAGWIRTLVAERALRLTDGGRQVTDKEEQVRLLTSQLAEFEARRVPELVALGILEPC